MSDREDVEGYVIDIACIRKHPAASIGALGPVHTRDCALMGHCIESGYGLVDDDGAVRLLDHDATLLVVEALRRSGRSEGIRLRAERQRNGEEMKTTRVSESG